MQSNLAFAALLDLLSKALLRMSGSFLLRAPAPTWLRRRTSVRLLWQASSGGKAPTVHVRAMLRIATVTP